MTVNCDAIRGRAGLTVSEYYNTSTMLLRTRQQALPPIQEPLVVDAVPTRGTNRRTYYVLIQDALSTNTPTSARRPNDGSYLPGRAYNNYGWQLYNRPILWCPPLTLKLRMWKAQV